MIGGNGVIYITRDLGTACKYLRMYRSGGRPSDINGRLCVVAGRTGSALFELEERREGAPGLTSSPSYKDHFGGGNGHDVAYTRDVK